MDINNKLENWLNTHWNVADIDCSIRYSCNIMPLSCSIVIKIKGEHVTFEKLLQLSQLLKTTSININTEHESGGCDTCDYGAESWVILYVNQAQLPVEVINEN